MESRGVEGHRGTPEGCLGCWLGSKGAAEQKQILVPWIRQTQSFRMQGGFPCAKFRMAGLMRTPILGGFEFFPSSPLGHERQEVTLRSFQDGRVRNE
eukprot:3074127-Heterocapsa_arctica.AAC.1